MVVAERPAALRADENGRSSVEWNEDAFEELKMFMEARSRSREELLHDLIREVAELRKNGLLSDDQADTLIRSAFASSMSGRVREAMERAIGRLFSEGGSEGPSHMSFRRLSSR